MADGDNDAIFSGITMLRIVWKPAGVLAVKVSVSDCPWRPRRRSADELFGLEMAGEPLGGEQT